MNDFDRFLLCVAIESSQPIIPGGEIRVLHVGSVDVLTQLFSAASIPWFELPDLPPDINPVIEPFVQELEAD